MAKVREIYVCRGCGSAHGRWMGKCPDCGAWDSLDAERIDPAAKKDPQRGVVQAWATRRDHGEAALALGPGARPLAEIGDGEAQPRLSTGIGELDRVLGGGHGAQGEDAASQRGTRGQGAPSRGPVPSLSRGLVPGSATLVGGAPGIGKSTLLLQAARAMADRGTRVLYVSSEESAQQIKLRAQRLDGHGPGVAADAADRLLVLADTNLARIVEEARKASPEVMVIDSIQMIYTPDVPAAPGSITQLRRCAADLVYLAKLSGIAVVMVGHVTKDGQLAGPRLLEHLVDTVLSFEGDRYHAHRVVRGIKNRFGATDEIGLFEMTGAGLREAPEGAGVVAAAGAGEAPRPGSVVCPVVTGTRCVLVELQALTATGFPGAAKRKSSGVDPSRLAMLIAVLEQHAELRLADRDVFASAVGGVRVAEPAADLALLLAIAGAHLRRALAPATAVVGEVGLGGEIRPVAQLDLRLKEAARLGCTRIVLPAAASRAAPAPPGVVVDRVRSVNEAIQRLG